MAELRTDPMPGTPATHQAAARKSIANIGGLAHIGDARTASAATLAWQDLVQALQQHWFWRELGWNDIVQRYRGSVLGPFWLTVTTGVFIAGLGPLYAALFGLDVKQYLPFMALGVLVWNFITGTISENCRAFIDAGSLMKQMKIPKMTIIFHILWRNVIVFAHNIPVYVAILFFCRISPNINMLNAIPGFILLCLNLLWIGVLLAIVCLRFRDVLQIVASILMLCFFFTPIMWNPKLQSINSWVVNANPFAALIELVRAPLLGGTVSAPLLTTALLSLVVGCTATTFVFARYRAQIIYWV